MIHHKTDGKPELPWRFLARAAPKHSVLLWLGDFPPRVEPESWAVLKRRYQTMGFRVDDPWEREFPAARLAAYDPSAGRLVTLDGGSAERARKHFEEAVRIQKGELPGPFVELAEGQSVANQDRAEFEKLMNQALALDPDKNPGVRLVSLIMQQRAKGLLAHVDELFAK